MGFTRFLQRRRSGAGRTLAATALAVCLAGSAGAQNIMINEVNRNTGNLTANVTETPTTTGNEWVEVVLVEHLTAAELNQYVVGDSQGARNSKLGGYQFTAMEGIASNFPAGTIIVIAGADSGLTEDLSYNPGGGNWNLTLVLGEALSSTYLTSVGSGTFDFAGDDVAYVDVTPAGMLTEEGFGLAWRGRGGPFGQSVSVATELQPANNGDTTLGTIGNDSQSLDELFWGQMLPSPGQPNDNDSNGLWIENLRLGIPSSDPLIRVPTHTLNFGLVLDDVFPLPTLELSIRNSAMASNNLTISSFSVQPNDVNFRVVPPTAGTPFNVAPGGSSTVTVEFDPLGTAGEYSATLVINHNDPNRAPVEVTLVGTALESSPPPGFTGTLPAVYEEDFDTLPNLEQIGEGGNSIPYPWSDNSTLAGWYAQQVNNAPTSGIIASTGVDYRTFDALAGALYSFGDDGIAERALGSVASGSTGTLVYGLRLRNDTAEVITGLRVEYVGEQWRKAPNASPHTLQFSYSISPTPFLGAPLSDDGFTAVPALDFVTPQHDGVVSPLDGNDPANRVEIDSTISNLFIEPGDEIFLRWRDVDDAGTDHALAIDDLRVTALPPAVPTVSIDESLATFVTDLGVPSPSQSYSVSGEFLEGDVTIVPPTGFQISLASGGPWTSNPDSIVLTESDGDVAPTTIHVRALSAVGGAISGNIVHSTSGAGDQLLPVSAKIIAPLVLAELNVAVQEDFNTLGSAAQAVLPVGFSLVGASLAPADYAFATGNSAGNTGAGALTATSSGNSYNFGDGVNAEATDRAVGFLNSGGFPSPRNIILTIENQTGNQLTELEVEFDFEKYRSGNREWNFNFHYSTNGVDWTLVEEASANFPSDGVNTIIYAPALSFGQSTTISGLSVAPGARMYLRWELVGVGGSSNGQALAIDNLSIIADGVPVEPGQLGDINEDGVINVADVTLLANLLAAGTPPSTEVGDVNQDGFVTEADVEALAELIVNE